MDQSPDSPCNETCTLDRQNVCEGCFRTISEIIGWGRASAAEKRAILGRAQERQNELVLVGQSASLNTP